MSEHPPAITEDIPTETAFLDSIGRDLQLALTANNAEPMDLRIGRLNGVRQALADMDDMNPNQAMLQAHLLASHYLVMGCVKGVGQTAGDHATAARLRNNAATLMRAFVGSLRELDRTQGNLDAGGSGAPPWKR